MAAKLPAAGEWAYGKDGQSIVSAVEKDDHPSSQEHYGGKMICESVWSPQNARLIISAPDLLAALEALFSNPHLDLGDLVYTICEKELQGWDGPAVKAWSDAVTAAKAAIKKARGEEVET
jgi:hypothetical protein